MLGLLRTGQAQEEDSTQTIRDTTRATVVSDTRTLQQLHQNNEADSSRFFYEKLKLLASKTRLTRELYRMLVREPYQNAPSRQEAPPPNPNQQYNGQVVGEIRIKRLDPFGPRVNDTLRQPAGFFEKAGNSLHMTTRAGVVRSSLLFRPGDRVDAFVLSDNERILRQLPYLHDARIFVVPRASSPDTVDIMVLTQDVWSISGDGSINGVRGGNVRVFDNNIFGLGHEFQNEVIYDSDPARGWGYRAMYRMPFIGKTFITGAISYVNTWHENSVGARFRRDFLAPTTKYAGGIEVSRSRLLQEFLPLDSDTAILRFPYAYNLADMWLGRSVPLPFGSQRFRDRTRLILAGRITATNFFERPVVRLDTNQLYQNRFLNLFSIGISNRSYYRDVLIYGFGRTEDVPYGGMFSLTGGAEMNEFGERYYAAAKASYGRFYNGFGYLVGTLNAGSFMRDGAWEQGVLRADLNYFSRLFMLNTLRVRQFVNVRYTKGIGRFDTEFIDISSRNGIRGIGSNGLRGEQSLVLNLETVVFTPLNILGFQVATFTYADLGWVTPEGVPIFSSSIYQGYGLGFRVRNENLTFNTFQIRFGYYPNIPGNRMLFRSEFSGIPALRLNDFTINAPEVIPFRQF
jgi:hypothetical protein